MSGIGATSTGPVIHVRPGRSTGWWGVVFMIVTESVLFGLLLFTYFYFRAGQGEWPPAGLPMPELRGSGIRTVVLLGSTFPLVWAERSLLKRGHVAKSAVWLFVTMAMAGVFLIGHVQEQFVLWEELAPTETAYGSVLMTILNFHAAHLVVGMLALAYSAVHLLRGRITQKQHSMLEISGMYWHFVDAIWVFVYSSLFLSPHLLGR
ncbi:MAG TPA: cytochrome c oxidase subunit 3 [Nitriliruptorales bacterium]|nr:cytochrome c oxidase subunit 3 [Nitriliruptorales bacterium]